MDFVQHFEAFVFDLDLQEVVATIVLVIIEIPVVVVLIEFANVVVTALSATF